MHRVLSTVTLVFLTSLTSAFAWPGPIFEPPFDQRCSPDQRQANLRNFGGTATCEEATLLALRYLKTHQKQDGSWIEDGTDVELTSLVTLAYLGRGAGVLCWEFGDSNLRSITKLILVGQKNQGLLTTTKNDKFRLYEHALATYALAESFHYCDPVKVNIPHHKETLEQAASIIIGQQNPKTGSWDHLDSRNNPGDLRLTAWLVQALIACKTAGIEATGLTSSLAAASKFILSQANHDGTFGTAGDDKNYPATGPAIYSLQLLGQGEHAAVTKGLDHIVNRYKVSHASPKGDLEACYFESLACFQAGGEIWKIFNKFTRDPLLKQQGDDGSWKNLPGKLHPLNPIPSRTGAPLHQTALCTLMLEVYYRYGPPEAP